MPRFRLPDFSPALFPPPLPKSSAQIRLLADLLKLKSDIVCPPEFP
jgi:hypothetical protein